MIKYWNRDYFFIFLNRAGSVLFSRYVIVPALMSTVFCGLMLWQPKVRQFGGVSKTVAQMYATIIGFTIVFRINMAFGRYFEGVRSIQAMFSKWRDAFVVLACFIEVSIAKHSEDERLGRTPQEAVRTIITDLKFSKARLLHWFSLLFAISVQSIVRGRELQADLAADLAEAATLQGSLPMEAGSQDEDATEAHMQKLERDRFALKGKVTMVGKMTQQEIRQVGRAHDVANKVMMWILLEVSSISANGRLLAEAPLLNRVFQELCSGQLAYFRAMQIQCVPFPFPFAQVVNWVLYSFFFFCPFIVSEIIEDVRSDDVLTLDVLWPAMLLNLFACAGYAALNEIAIELEDPFGDDGNDYPIQTQQWAAMGVIEDSYFQEHPMADSVGVKYGTGTVREGALWMRQQSFAFSLGSISSPASDSGATPEDKPPTDKPPTNKPPNDKPATDMLHDYGRVSSRFLELRTSLESFLEEVERHSHRRQEECEKIKATLGPKVPQEEVFRGEVFRSSI